MNGSGCLDISSPAQPFSSPARRPSVGTKIALQSSEAQINSQNIGPAKPLRLHAPSLSVGDSSRIPQRVRVDLKGSVVSSNFEVLTMPITYSDIAIPGSVIPKASSPIFQHMLDIYTSETNKVISVWREFRAADMPYRPHPHASSVEEIMKHQLLSERRFFGEFLGLPEPEPSRILPEGRSPEDYAGRMRELAVPRLAFFAAQDEEWWLQRVSFFDVVRERIWIFWRRVLHTTHHRTQLTVYLRLLNRPVPSTYGPTADVTWKGADPTHSAEAAGRK